MMFQEDSLVLGDFCFEGESVRNVPALACE